MSTSTKINTGWTKILTEKGLLAEIKEKGHATITSAQMNEWYPAVNARLMSKFDTLESRPAIFKKHGLSLWPTDNGVFQILQSEDTYIKLDAKKATKVAKRCFNARDLGFELATLNIDNISTESQALAIMAHSGIMNAIHNASGHRVALTDGGRNRRQKAPIPVTLRTPKGAVTLDCEGVQMEPDAVHESDHMVTMTEAKLIRNKRGFAGITSLHARQMAFPHVQLESILDEQGCDKSIESAALYAWKKDKQTPWQFLWIPVEMSLDGHTRFNVIWERALLYILVEDQNKEMAPAGRRVLRNDLAAVATDRPETNASFPQFNNFAVLDQIASDMGKLGGIDITDDLPQKTMRKWRRGEDFQLSKIQRKQIRPSDLNDLMRKFQFESEWEARNRAYLVNALKWLGLVEDYCPVTNTIVPSDLCVMLAYVDHDIRIQRLWNLMMSSPIMRAAAHGQPITMEMRIAEGLGSKSTYERRMQSARKWTQTVQAWMDASKGVNYIREPIAA